MAALGGSSIESGALAGVPIVIAASLGANAVILDANAVAYAGQDDIRIDYSYEAALELTDAPADPTTAASVITSLWQNNLAALRVEQFVSWARADLSAVKYCALTLATPV